jgi:hypothetical protein
MKVTVRDAEILKTIEPQQLREYLQAHGWYEDRPFLDNATIWLKQDSDRGEFEILLPLKQNLRDYVPRIREAIETLEIVENRSQLEILSELITTANNITIQGVVMQIHTPNTDQLSGQITLLGVVGDKLRKIKIELFNHNYILAIKAYQERFPISCTGDLIKENDTFILKNPRDLTLDAA